MRSQIIKQYLLPSFLVTLLAFLPFFLNKELILERNNDLTEFFWPLFYLIKQSILVNHRIPITNDFFFAGTPLLADPQNPLWYLPNIIFLIFNIDSAILISIFIHIFFGTLGINIVSRKVFKFSFNTSICVSIFYLFSSQLFSFLEAGHYGLIISWSWLPYLLFATYNLSLKTDLRFLLLFSIASSSIYVNHILTFGISFLVSIAFLLYKKSFKSVVLGSVGTLIFIFPALIAQLSWFGKTTRSLLIQFPETFPVWRGKKEFLKSIFLFNPETEKAITIGFSSFILIVYGFIKLKKKQKKFLVIGFLTLFLIVANNVSPIFNILLKLDFFLLMRVATRLWFLVFFCLTFLFGFGLERINKKLFYVFGLLVLIESVFNSYSYFKKPVNLKNKLSDGIYEVLEKDKGNYRVLCIDHCISQKEAVVKNIKLVDGYGTLQNLDFYYGLQDALNTTWKGYTLFLPPFDVHNANIQPNAEKLSKYNTKYIILKNDIKSSDFKFIKKSDNYYLYQNTLWK